MQIYNWRRKKKGKKKKEYHWMDLFKTAVSYLYRIREQVLLYI